jgi:hypothetical protein
MTRERKRTPSTNTIGSTNYKIMIKLKEEESAFKKASTKGN